MSAFFVVDPSHSQNVSHFLLLRKILKTIMLNVHIFLKTIIVTFNIEISDNFMQIILCNCKSLTIISKQVKKKHVFVQFRFSTHFYF